MRMRLRTSVLLCAATIAGGVFAAESLPPTPNSATQSATSQAGRQIATSIKFYGVECKAAKVVYVLDHTGSMLDTFDFLREEAIRSVNNLAEDQSFNVVMFSEKGIAVFPKLQKATPANKKTFAAKMKEYRAQGMNCDLLEPYEDAFKKAFALEPEVIYFLTDGHFDPRLTNVVTKLNAAKKVQINTLAYVNHDPEYEDQLKDLAKKNGGSYKFVSEKDLGT